MSDGLDDPSTPWIDVIIVDEMPAGTWTARGYTTHADMSMGKPGEIYFTGAVGSFSLNRVTARSKPLVGTPDEPEITVSSVHRSSTAGTLIIEVTDACFALGSAGVYQLSSPLGGNTNGTVSFTESVDLGNNGFGEGPDAVLYTNQLGPFPPGSFSQEKTATFQIEAPQPVSLTKRITVVHTGANHLTTLGGGGYISQVVPGRPVVPRPLPLGLAGRGWEWFAKVPDHVNPPGLTETDLFFARTVEADEDDVQPGALEDAWDRLEADGLVSGKVAEIEEQLESAMVDAILADLDAEWSLEDRL